MSVRQPPPHTLAKLQHKWVLQNVIANVDCSSGRGRLFTAVWLFVCLSVFTCDISQTDAARITKVNIEMFHDEPWKPTYLGSKVKVMSHSNIARVFALLWVLAASSSSCSESTTARRVNREPYFKSDRGTRPALFVGVQGHNMECFPLFNKEKFKCQEISMVQTTCDSTLSHILCTISQLP